MFIERPLLGYPALLFTPISNGDSRLLADAPAAFASERLPGYPDPDVARVRIDVRVASLALDPANESGPEPLRALYTTFREFHQNPTQPLELTIAFEDCDDIALFDPGDTAGPLRLPTARTLEITFTSIARRDPGMSEAVADPLSARELDASELDREDAALIYFGKQAIRLGGRRAIKVRRESLQENAWLGLADRPPLQGIFLRPAPLADIHLQVTNAAAGAREQGPKTAIQRLAAHLDLEQRHMTLSSAPGRRVVFGAGAAVRHILSPEHSTITFADESSITSQWLMVIAVRIQRDWTWDALGDEGLSVMRAIDGGPSERVGNILPRRCISGTAVRRDVELDRSFTELIFIDAIDPKPQSGGFPRELTVNYDITAPLRSGGDPAVGWNGSVTLPIATTPTQVPRIVSAGIALAPYERDSTYSRTAARRRMLWVEFAEPIADPNDAYFARVTAHAADPMLVRTEPAAPPGPLEAPLEIDAEPIRAIVPNQPRDASGSMAMQPLIPADGEHGIRHFLLPLPKAVAEQSAELFGFFVYEFCVGHAKGWRSRKPGIACRSD